MDLSTLIGLGVFAWGSAYLLYVPSNRLYSNFQDYTKQGRHKHALESLNEKSVREAIDQAVE